MYSRINSNDLLISVGLTGGELPLELTAWWEDQAGGELAEYSEVLQTTVIHQLLMNTEKPFSHSLWTQSNVLKSGVLVEVKGECKALIDMESWISKQALDQLNRKRDLLEYQWHKVAKENILWIRFKPAGRSFFSSMIQLISDDSDVDYIIYRPLTIGEKLWVKSDSPYELSPHLTMSTKQLLQTSGEDWLLISESQLRWINMRHLFTPMVWLNQFLDHFKDDLQIHPTQVTSQDQWTIRPRWLKRRNQRGRPQGLLFERESHAIVLTQSIIDLLGLYIAKKR